MSGAPGTAPAERATPVGEDSPRGAGWVVFASTMLAILGILNVVYGIAAISNSSFFVNDAKYVIGSLNTWGWFMLIVGAIQFLSALAILGGSELGRWIGILSAAANAVIQLLAIPSYPFLSITLFTVDVLVMYGLIAYGGSQLRAQL
jgi:hypothetical protein